MPCAFMAKLRPMPAGDEDSNQELMQMKDGVEFDDVWVDAQAYGYRDEGHSQQVEKERSQYSHARRGLPQAISDEREEDIEDGLHSKGPDGRIEKAQLEEPGLQHDQVAGEGHGGLQQGSFYAVFCDAEDQDVGHIEQKRDREQRIDAGETGDPESLAVEGALRLEINDAEDVSRESEEKADGDEAYVDEVTKGQGSVDTQR